MTLKILSSPGSFTIKCSHCNTVVENSAANTKFMSNGWLFDPTVEPKHTWDEIPYLYCPHCDNHLDESDIIKEKITVEKGTVCGHCRTINPQKAKTCSSCSAPLSNGKKVKRVINS